MAEKFPRLPGGGKRMSWEEMLGGGHRTINFVRIVFRHLPSEPRCRLCLAPFHGPGGRITAMIGFGPSRMNPNFCANCLEQLPPGGAEVDIAVLFVDIRNSTAIGESTDATLFAERMNAFYKIATSTVIAHDGLIDKLIGDEVLALFVPGFCGPQYVQRAFEAGLSLLTAVRQDAALASWLSVGVGLHSGPAFVGNVGGQGVFDFTALGDTVNTGARLQAAAKGGELVVSERACEAITGIGASERTTIELKGKAEPVAVRVIRPGPQAVASGPPDSGNHH
jgi:adenylate cyclase